MKKLILIALSALWAFAFGPVVSAQEAAKMLGTQDLVIHDVNAPKVYNKGHIQGTINAPINLWRTHHDSYLLVRTSKRCSQEPVTSPSLPATFGSIVSKRMALSNQKNS